MDLKLEYIFIALKCIGVGKEGRGDGPHYDWWERKPRPPTHTLDDMQPNYGIE